MKDEIKSTKAINDLDEDTDHFLRDRLPATHRYSEMYDEEIGFGEKLHHTSGDIFEVKAFKILPTPRVWSGWKWYLLANCKRHEE